MTYDEWLEYEVKQLERDKRYWLDNFKRLRDDKVNLIDENAQLKHEIDKQKNYNMSHAQRISELKKQYEKLYKPHEVFKFKEQIERLINDKYKYIELYKQKYDENYKLTDELSLKTRQNSILSLEINELKRELKEYRGF